jgi:Dolichyl-phosphate-mannose-protein mannosyltransferase
MIDARPVSQEMPRQRATKTNLSNGTTVATLLIRCFAYCAFPLAGCGYALVYILALHDGPSNLVHTMFWLCTILGIGAVQLFIRSGCSDRESGLVAALAGGLFYLPKYFRSPRFFNFHDELAHWYATDQLLSGHGAFAPNPETPVVQYYPGLHVVTAALSSTTGLSIFAAGNIVCAWAHITMCVAVYGICRQLSKTPGTALTAALLYAASPAFFYFDAQFAYETLGLAFFTVALLCALRIARPSNVVSWAELALMGFLVLALVVTHHVTSYLLALTLTVLTVACRVLRHRALVSRRNYRQLVMLTTVAIAANLTWLFGVARGTISYLGGPIMADLTAVRSYFQAGGHTSRQLFTGAAIPEYEVFGSYAAVVALFTLYVWLLMRIRRRDFRRDPRQWAMTLLGGLYFASLPVVFVFNDQTAKRPWAFAFVGLAATCAPIAHRLLAARIRLVGLIGLCIVVILYVGGVVTFSGQDIRFPDSYNAGSDSLATTPDLIAAATWLDAHYGNGNRFIGDATIAQVVGAYGRQYPLTYENFGYRPWNVVFPKQLGPEVYDELNNDGARFIVIDQRIATTQPLPRAYYFNAAEPDANSGIRPFDIQSLDKFKDGPFDEVYNNGNIIIWEYLNWVRPSSTRGP